MCRRISTGSAFCVCSCYFNFEPVPLEDALTQGRYPTVLTYLENVFDQCYGRESVVLRTTGEMMTLVEALGALIE